MLPILVDLFLNFGTFDVDLDKRDKVGSKLDLGIGIIDKGSFLFAGSFG